MSVEHAVSVETLAGRSGLAERENQLRPAALFAAVWVLSPVRMIVASGILGDHQRQMFEQLEVLSLGCLAWVVLVVVWCASVIWLSWCVGFYRRRSEPSFA